MKSRSNTRSEIPSYMLIAFVRSKSQIWPTQREGIIAGPDNHILQSKLNLFHSLQIWIWEYFKEIEWNRFIMNLNLYLKWFAEQPHVIYSKVNWNTVLRIIYVKYLEWLTYTHVCKCKNDTYFNCSRNRWRRVKEQYSCMIYLIYCKNLCIYSNVPTQHNNNKKIVSGSWVWWCTPVISAFKRQRHRDSEFQVSLDYVVRACLKKQNTNSNK
jgi:hypothetical protein